MSVADDVALLEGAPATGLEGKVAWVTGASRGLGKAIAYAIAGAGASVLLTARSQELLDHAVQEIREHGGTAGTTLYVDGGWTAG